MTLHTLLRRGAVNTKNMVFDTLIQRVPLNTAARTLHQAPCVNLEIERKFTPTPASLMLLCANAKNPTFTKHTYLGERTLDDTYFDKDNVFMSRGMYVRLRNSNWEAKVSIQKHGDGENDSEAFTEYTDQGQIRHFVEQTLLSAGCAPKYGNKGGVGKDVLDELEPIAKIVARRAEWDIDGFHVVVDETQWGYQIGEIELTRTVFEGDKQKAAEMMHMDIMLFMWEHADVFLAGGGERPMGKLSAYFQWKQGKDWPGRS